MANEELTPQQREEATLKFWEENKIFEKSLAQRRKAKPFVFFEGPPTANGRPGIHHFIGRAFKDLFNRYKTMRGYFVLRKSGWDTQGLPVEIETEKTLGLKSKREIEAYGVANFNQKARENVWLYQEEWERFTKRIGFWLDLKDPYITYDPKYIESLWSILSQINKRDLLFKSHKVVPYCTRCGTALSSHELAQGYQSVTENSVYLKFRIKNHELRIEQGVPVYILAWTTTPWTLPGNVALAVGENLEYRIAKKMDKNGVEYLILAANPIVEDKVFGGSDPVTVEYLKDMVMGKDLVGLKYEPLFNIPELQNEKSYQIYPADFVTTTDGTGVVHTAVMYGEDDYVLGDQLGLPKYHTVDKNGNFVASVPGLAGLYVKDPKTEALVINQLKEHGQLFKEEPYTHDYPFCWRCSTPLLYYATDAWFIGMTKLKEELIANNEKINWYPEHLKEGRFGEWLRNTRDWAFSRERYWGTPLPIWECKECKTHTVVGSYAELEAKRFRPANKYILMRHGERDDGANQLASSGLEDPIHLTESGKKAVARQAKVLHEKFGKLDAIFSSDFIRTRETAEIIAQEFGTEIIYDARLREFNHGELSGRPIEEVHQALDLSPAGFKKTIGGGESWEMVRQRTGDFIREIDAKYEGKNILIVSHGDPLWILRGVMTVQSDEELLLARKENYLAQGEWCEVSLKNYPLGSDHRLDPHRPFIDEIVLACEQCHGPMRRVPEVGDIWFDSGAMPYAQWHYPFENKELVDGGKQFPADFICEAIDQTRGWFYSLLAVSTLLGREPAYKNVISYGHVLDEKGQKMSKSKGNIVNPWEVIEKYGVDATRWFFYTVNQPGESKLFTTKEVEQKLRGMLGILRNTVRFYELYATEAVDGQGGEPQTQLDHWLWSRLHGATKVVTESMDHYDPTLAARTLEKFIIEDLSQWWLRRSRARFQRPQTPAEQIAALTFMRRTLLVVAKLIAPFTPFIAESVFVDLGGDSPTVLPNGNTGASKNESIHLADWPELNESAINPELENAMAKVQTIVTLALAIRKEKNIKVRQPLSRLMIKGASAPSDELVGLLKDELNVKEITWEPGGELGVEFDLKIDDELRQEGWARELIRQIQDLRKEAGYDFADRIAARWQSDDPAVLTMLARWGESVKSNSGLSDLGKSDDQADLKIFRDLEIGDNKKIWLGLAN